MAEQDKAREENKLQQDETPSPETQEHTVEQTTQKTSKETDDPQIAIETYRQTASNGDADPTYSGDGTVQSEQEPSGSDGVNVAPVTISTPFHAVKAIILKPNPVFARLKETANWSWLPFLIVAFCSALPSWLYFNSVDMNWYTDLIIQMEYADVSPSEKAQMKQMMMQDNLGDYTAIVTIISLILMYALLALYLYKITQIDEENTCSYGDWYGFMWWISLPFALFSLLTALLILAQSGPEIRPEMLSPLSLASLLSLSLNSEWFGWAQGIGPETLWVIYLIAVGVSQWTRLTSRECFTIAAAPFIAIYGIWAAFIIL